ncbi:hypothetical protein XENOCAPTIV_028270 [Xenoophorus captivus]|uniref:Dynein heavy chain ATP-binding dynein motor region domain-containing protein n=1 Tax=Xenoophorus captivus TaxID=1517983 RepID=A0ABV0R594_9TELE
MPDYLRVLENAIQFGNPVLLQNVQEELDPFLNPVLNKSLTCIGLTHMHTLFVKLNLFKCQICDFFLVFPFPRRKAVGLEAQLLGIVVRKERPELEQQKESLVISIAAGKKGLQDLEDEILKFVPPTLSLTFLRLCTEDKSLSDI